MRTQNVGEWLVNATRRLDRSGLRFGHGAISAASEASWIAATACRLSPRLIARHVEREMQERQVRRAERLLDQRMQSRKPLAYILREAWLGDQKFYIDERVIVPRSLIAGLILDRIRPWLTDHHVMSRGLDLCTGSGCLAVLMAKQFRGMRVDAVDISSDALAVAKINQIRSGLQHQIRLVQSDLFRSLPRRRYDLIISNPPYVTDASMKRLPKEYRHEPDIALRGGRDGLDIVRRIIRDCPSYLTQTGLLILEIGRNRGAFERAFPDLPAFWIDTPGESDLVAVLEAGALSQMGKTRG
jgi:ribosomal protein L3 glutamine methyltransferase